jgi:hypothetical protein
MTEFLHVEMLRRTVIMIFQSPSSGLDRPRHLDYSLYRLPDAVI